MQVADWRWLLVKSQPRRERLAEENLRNQQALTYCPRFADRSGKLQVLFPCYLFVATGAASTRFIDNTRGVAQRVQIGGVNVIVPVAVILELREREDEDGLIVLDESQSIDLLKPGAPIRMIGGPFLGSSGICERMLPSDRVAVLLQILGHATPVTAPRSMVEAA